MAGLNTEYLEDGIRSICNIAKCKGYTDIVTISEDLLVHIDEALE